MLGLSCKRVVSVLSPLALNPVEDHIVPVKACSFFFGVVVLQINFRHHRPLSPLRGFDLLFAWQKVTVSLDTKENTYMLRFGAIRFWGGATPLSPSLWVFIFPFPWLTIIHFKFCALQIFPLYFNYFWDIFHSGSWFELQNLPPPLPSLLLKLLISLVGAGMWSTLLHRII